MSTREHGTAWVETANRQPDEGLVVDAMDSGGHVQRLVREGRLWFFEDRSMYVYYTPQRWRRAEASR